jgi:phage terminase large subunit
MTKLQKIFEPVFIRKIAEVLFSNARYKVLYGGRGSGKTIAAADYILLQTCYSKKLVLCTREFQTSIRDSVHRVLSSRIQDLGLSDYFDVQQNSILSKTGSEIIFKGLQRNASEIKSTEGVDIVWLEEAEKTSRESLNILIPTIRKKGSEFIIVFNPDDMKSPIYQDYVINTPENCKKVLVNYVDNPFFKDTELFNEMERDKRLDNDKYRNIWLGEVKQLSDAIIFKDKWIIEDFITEKFKPERFFLGADWGFASDPSVIIRSFIHDKFLYIDYVEYGYGTELDDIPALFSKIPNSKNELIYADCARPETISHLRNKGWNISAAKKWAGSVEDGIAYLKNFEKIIIHPRCKYFIDEAGSYCYKKDSKTDEILPIIVDKNNHGWDALRYAHEKYITAKKGGVMIF